VEEGVRHEVAYLLADEVGPVLVYVMEVEDVQRSRDVAARSAHAIDLEHRNVMSRAVGEAVPAELLLDLQG
jgi:hypothetical protein